MYINKVTLTNYRCLESCDLKLSKGFNLLVGNNGSGKSSVLEGISVGLASFFEKIDTLPSKGIMAKDVRSHLNQTGDATWEEVFSCPSSITTAFQLDNNSYTVTRERKDQTSSARTTCQPKELGKIAQELFNCSDSLLPLLSYQCASRVWQQKRGDADSQMKALTKPLTRKRGYANCLDSAMDIKGIMHWILNMDYIAYQEKKEIKEYQSFKNLVSLFMQEMEGLEIPPEIHYSASLKEVIYKSGEVSTKLSDQSAGYQSILWMVMDLAFRTVTLNPQINLDLSPIKGVVLIDEIDMHLHPKWQWKIVDALTKTFPEVQFIAATHSPSIISSCKEGNIILVSPSHEIKYLSSYYGNTVNDVLDSCLGSMEQPQRVTKLSADFDVALDALDE